MNGAFEMPAEKPWVFNMQDKHSITGFSWVCIGVEYWPNFPIVVPVVPELLFGLRLWLFYLVWFGLIHYNAFSAAKAM